MPELTFPPFSQIMASSVFTLSDPDMEDEDMSKFNAFLQDLTTYLKLPSLPVAVKMLR